MEFPPTFVINLINRSDRLKALYSNFEKKWPVQIERIDAVKASPGWKGCIRSHKKALQICKARNLPFAIVLEDDCVLESNGYTQFLEVLPYLMRHSDEWDVFIGGPTFVDSIEVKQRNPPLFQIKCYAAHFCLYNRRSITSILEKFSEDDPWDVFLRKNCRLWCTLPHIAKQEAGSSDITDSNTDYSNAFEISKETLQKAYGIEGFQSEIQYSNPYSIPILLSALALTLWLFSPANRRKPFR